jgi:hypothetical protein
MNVQHTYIFYVAFSSFFHHPGGLRERLAGFAGWRIGERHRIGLLTLKWVSRYLGFASFSKISDAELSVNDPIVGG